MKTKAERITHDILLVGGGHAHVEVIRRHSMAPIPGARMTLVAREVTTPYTGMLPGMIAGIYSRAEAHIDLQKLCRHAGVRLIHAPATGLDPVSRQLFMAGRPPLSFDLLSLDTGSTPDLTAIDGGREHAIGVKPVDRFLDWLSMMDGVTAEAGLSETTICIVGGGAGGTELALSLAWRFHGKCRITLIAANRELAAGHNAGVRRALADAVHEAGIAVRTGRRATAIDAEGVTLSDGERISADHVIATTAASAPDWLRETGLTLDDDGFIAVDDCLQSLSHPGIFATGDVASMQNHDLPKAGVYAVRQGPVLAENLRLAARGKRLEPYRPQQNVLALISTGKPHAVASWGPFSLSGDWVWTWKDWIDRRWMEKYQQLEVMPEERDEDTGETLMRCGGCGSKVSDIVLKTVLSEIRTRYPHAVGDLSDDAALIDPPPGMTVVQSIDQFRAMIDDPWLFGRIATEHCLSDLHAMGATPYGALATVSLPDGDADKLADDLSQLLGGVAEGLGLAGSLLLGGHTAEGPELSLGLAVTGFVPRTAATMKGGAQPGDRLILTKPLGTGAILAADMRGLAGAESMEIAIASMLASNGPAARILKEFGAHAVTDVTGFGLAGHLIEMMTASRTAALVKHEDIPVLPGFREAEAVGILSTMHPKNLAYAAAIDGEPDNVLFDPQTSGGLLAAVPAEFTAACLDALISAGIDARDIGSVASRDQASKPIWIT
jgi:selenide,water dikinase